MNDDQINLATHFSDIFEVSASSVEDYGAFNVSLINDLPLFVDPFLLFNSDDAIYQELHARIIEYVAFLRDKALAGGASESLLRAWFTFPEVRQNWLGYSRVGNSGSGLGLDFAWSLYKNLATVFRDFGEESVTRGSHLEKLCLVKDGVGRDNISDFTVNLIKKFLAEYTQDFARQFLRPDQVKRVALEKVEFNYQTESWITKEFVLPWCDGDHVLLTPRNLLTKDKIWINKNDIFANFDDIATSIPNDQLRAQISNYLFKALPKRPKRGQRDAAIARLLDEYPVLFDYYIRYKEDRGDEAVAISSGLVFESQQVFVDHVHRLVTLLLRNSTFYQQDWSTYEEARERAAFLKDVVENKGGHRLFYYDGVPIRRESDLHILYRLTWFASPSDVTREANDGRGPVDFKISRGATDKTLVEFKLASNTQLRRNLERQAPVYQRASDAERAVKVIFFFTDRERRKVLRILEELKIAESKDIILVDARSDNKPSGSRA